VALVPKKEPYIEDTILKILYSIKQRAYSETVYMDLRVYNLGALPYNSFMKQVPKMIIPGKISNILIFNPFGIGDVLFSTPLIRNIKQNLPNATISYLCNRRTYSLLEHNSFIDVITIFEKDEWRALAKKSKIKFIKEFFNFRKQIKKMRFDAVIDLSLNSQYGFFFKSLGIKNRIGFNYKNRGKFLTHKIDVEGGYKNKHVVRYYLDLLKFFQINPQEYEFDIFLTDQDKKRALDILDEYNLSKDDLLIGVCPGSGDSWQKTAYFKRWPKDNFLEICNKLDKESGAKIIIFGSLQEGDVCQYLYEGMRNKPINLCGKISLREFCSLIYFCRLIITNDGGPFHIAQAMGKKSLVFFGPVDDKVYGAFPDDSNCLVIKSDIACRPCYQSFRFSGCDIDKQCLRNIDPEYVFSALSSFAFR